MQGRMSFIFETSNQDGEKRYEQPPASMGPTRPLPLTACILLLYDIVDFI